MADILCSYGWHESLGIIMSVCVGFLYISNSSVLFFLFIVRSKKLMDFWCSFSILNVMFVFCLLNSIMVLSMFLFDCKLLRCRQHI
jgi:hypothetical protein